MDNSVLPFILYDAEIKGRITRLSDQLDIILNQHNYPDEIARPLGKLLMLASMLGSQFKDEITLTIQLQTEGRLKYIVVDYQMPSSIRGYAQFDQEGVFVNDALLSVTVDYQGQRYQGVVEVDNMQIDKAIEKYFAQSEQIKTSVKLAIWKVAESWYGAGIMIQKLPNEESEEAWNEANILLSTLKDNELLDPNLSLERLLYLVYHEAKVRIYDYLPIVHKCSCSRERASQIVKSLGIEEAKDLIIDNKLSVSCQFCNVSQDFNANDIESIYQ